MTSKVVKLVEFVYVNKILGDDFGLKLGCKYYCLVGEGESNIIVFLPDGGTTMPITNDENFIQISAFRNVRIENILE